MQFGDALVIAPEKGAEILRKIFLVDLGQRADDAEVEQDEASVSLRFQADLDIARMHVGVEKPVAKNLGEENRHAIARQLLHVHAGVAQSLHLADRDALHALHHHHVGQAVVPDHFRDHHQIELVHVAAQLGRIGGFPQQVQFVVQVFVKLADHLARLEPLAVGRCILDPAGHHVHQRQVFFDRGQHVGPEHLDGHFTSTGQGRKMHLGD